MDDVTVANDRKDLQGRFGGVEDVIPLQTNRVLVTSREENDKVFDKSSLERGGYVLKKLCGAYNVW